MPESSSPRTLIVIFGAAVRPDGRPSLSLLRRIAYGLDAAMAEPGADVLCSGGVGRAGPSEASVMADRLKAAGLPAARIRLDEASCDTLQSVVATRRVMEEGGYKRCVVCSDGYHLPRIRLLLRMLGVRSEAGATAPGHGCADWRHVIDMRLREAAAIPYDAGIVAVRRGQLLRGEG